MAFVEMPAVVVMIVVGVVPIAAGVRRTVPTSANPHVASLVDSPIAIDPSVSFARRRRAALVAQRRRSATDDDTDLRECRSTD
jgi:uncharacterized protein (DUF983 family)